MHLTCDLGSRKGMWQTPSPLEALSFHSGRDTLPKDGVSSLAIGRLSCKGFWVREDLVFLPPLGRKARGSVVCREGGESILLATWAKCVSELGLEPSSYCYQTTSMQGSGPVPA